ARAHAARWLADPSRLMESVAFRVLLALHGPGEVEVLEKLAASPHTFTRGWAAWVLCAIGPPAARDALPRPCPASAGLEQLTAGPHPTDAVLSALAAIGEPADLAAVEAAARSDGAPDRSRAALAAWVHDRREGRARPDLPLFPIGAYHHTGIALFPGDAIRMS